MVLVAGKCAPRKQRSDATIDPRFGPDCTVDSTTSRHARYVDMTASSRAASTSSLDTRTCGVHAQAAHPSVAKSATIAGATARPTPACTPAPFSTVTSSRSHRWPPLASDGRLFDRNRATPPPRSLGKHRAPTPEAAEPVLAPRGAPRASRQLPWGSSLRRH